MAPLLSVAHKIPSIGELFLDYLQVWGIGNLTWKYGLMIFIGFFLIYLAIVKKYEPLLLLPIGFGVLLANIPGGMMASSDVGGLMYYLYKGVEWGIYPPLIFLGIGVLTDFTPLLSNPKIVILGAAAQVGVFLTLVAAIYLGFDLPTAAAIGLIGGADGPTSIYISSKLAPQYLGPIAISAYSYMALVPIIQPPIMRLLTTRKERLIRMPPPRKVSKTTKIIFPIAAFVITSLISPQATALVGMLMLGNLMRECGVVDRLSQTAQTAILDTTTIFIGLSVGASTKADVFLTTSSLKIFCLGAIAFGISTASGVLFAKLLNLFSKHKINPLIGAAGVSAVPDSARVVQKVAAEEDPTNFLLMHAMAPNVSGVIGTAIAAGVLLSIIHVG